MNFKNRLFFLLLFFLQTLLIAQNEKINLLLKWHNQFQFAGFYMAKEKGFYEELGLDVDIKVSINEHNAQLLAKQQNTYAILDPYALVEQAEGVQIRALAAVFQQSPLVFISLKTSDIKSPQDFIGKRVMGIIGKTDASLDALLKVENISREQFSMIQKHYDINDLIYKNVDVISGYLTDAPFVLERLGYEYNIIDPLAYGIDFYGDMIFTSQMEATQNPSRAKRFLAASEKGWKYALANVDETIGIILSKYHSKLDKEALEYEAKRVKELMLLDRIPFGQMNNNKIKNILEYFANLGHMQTVQGASKIFKNPFIQFGDPFGFWKTLSQEEKSFLQNHPKFVVGVRKNYLPFYGQNSEQKTEGIILEINRKLENILGVNLELTPMSLSTIHDLMKEKKIDLFYGTKVGSGDSYIYTQGLGTFSGAAYSLDPNLKIEGLKELEGKRVGLIEGSAAQRVLSKVVTIKVVPHKTTFDLINALNIGAIDVLLEPLPIINHYKKVYNITNLHVNGIFYENPLHLSIGLQKNMEVMQRILNKAIAYIGEDELEKIFSFWIADKDETYLLHLSKEERTYLAQTKSVKVGIDNNWAPFEFSKNGLVQGYAIDFLRLVEKKSGLKFEFEDRYIWSKTLEKFKQGELDMLSLMGHNHQREEFTLFSSPILSPSISLAYKKENKEKSLEDLNKEKKSLGVIKDFWLIEPINEKFKDINIIEYTQREEGLLALSTGKLDAFIDSTTVLNYHINRNLMSNILVSPPIILGEKAYEKFYIGVQKKNPILHSIIQKSLENIPERDILELQRKWFGNILEGSVSKKLLLSEKQKKFIFNHNKIRLGIDTSWAPYDYVDENGAHQGIVKDITNYILKENLGLEIENITQPLWKKHIEDIDNGYIDMIAGISKTPERAAKMLFSIPYVKIPLVVIGREDGILVDSLDDLNYQEVGVVDGYLTNALLKEKYPNIKIIPYPDIKTGLIDLSREKIDYFFDTLAAVNDVIKNNGLTNLKLLGQTGESFELSFGIRKDWPELQDAINKMISSMPKEKVDQMLDRWISMGAQKVIDYSLIWKIILAFGVIIGTFIYWNRKLSSEIGRRVKIEKELDVARAKAEKANNAKSEFLSNMSHEIRTPMNAVIGFAELTQKMDLPQKALHNIQIIHKSAKALIAIINDILDISKIEAGKLEIQKESVNLTNLAEDLYAIFSLRADDKDLFFDVAFDKNIPKALVIDEVRIRQILVNLIGNAIKFTQSGFVKVHFQTQFFNEKYVELSISVSDSGIGVKNSDLERIFGIFEQQSGQDNKTYGGTGLGLSISQRLAYLMGGNISVESPGENQGATFTLCIPNVEISDSIPQKSATTVHLTKFAKSKILVVDDIDVNVDLLESVLLDYGFEVIKTLSGFEAISLAKEHLPQLILMDIKMPKFDGYEASKAIKNQEETKDIPIVAVSASVLGEREIAHGFKCFDDFVEKPVDIDELENVLKKFLQHDVIVKEKKATKEERFILPPLTQMQKDEFLEKIEIALENGDLQVSRKIATMMEENGFAKERCTVLKDAVENFDIDIIESELKKLKKSLS